MKNSSVKTGLETFFEKRIGDYTGARAGFLVNPTSVNSSWKHSTELVLENRSIELVRLFAPEHGLNADAQDMVELDHTTDTRTGVPVYSLYGSTRKPRPGELEDLDIVVFDIQDVGSRYYTFIYSLAYMMEASAKTGCRVVVLDRPNPINGVHVEGPVQHPGYESFVGLYPIAVRHGMTVGELATLFNVHFGIGCSLDIIPMEGWKREMDYAATGLPWVIPSPNMPTPDTALVYPGMCLIEGTNISEGRGTTRPFEITGAPFIRPYELSNRLNGLRLPGIVFRPLSFIPTFHKWHGESCGGVQLHVVDEGLFRPFLTGVAIIREISHMYPALFQWRQPPYEYETEKLPIDILTGDPRIRVMIEDYISLDKIETSWQENLREFLRIRNRFLIY